MARPPHGRRCSERRLLVYRRVPGWAALASPTYPLFYGSSSILLDPYYGTCARILKGISDLEGIFKQWDGEEGAEPPGGFWPEPEGLLWIQDSGMLPFAGSGLRRIHSAPPRALRSGRNVPEQTFPIGFRGTPQSTGFASGKFRAQVKPSTLVRDES